MAKLSAGDPAARGAEHTAKAPELSASSATPGRGQQAHNTPASPSWSAAPMRDGATAAQGTSPAEACCGKAVASSPSAACEPSAELVDAGADSATKYTTRARVTAVSQRGGLPLQPSAAAAAAEAQPSAS